MLRAAIVGCGGIAQVHAQVLHHFEDVTLAAFADIKLERAEQMAETYGGNAYRELNDLLEQEQIDVLHICTPHYLHTPMAKAAAERGIRVFTEKPPVISREQLAEFRALEGKVPVGICFQNRYNRSVQYLHKLLSSGETGAVKGARAFVTWFRDAAYYTESGWRGALATEGGGALINQSIHTMDLLVQFLGTPLAVEATTANHHLKGVIEVEDTVEAYIQFQNCTASFYATTAYCDNSPVLIELCCEHATLRMEETLVTCRWEDGRTEQVQFADPEHLGKSYWGNGHYVCIRDYYDCLKTGRSFPVSISDVTDTMELMLGVYASATEHKVITL